MDKMRAIEFAKAIKPVRTICDGLGYRCSAYLTDGTYLPCVMLASPVPRCELAQRRFEETRGKKMGVGMDDRSLIASFVTAGNRVNDYDLCSLEPSPYAIPVERLAEIRGETSMSWTEFTVVMNDGKEFPFGTNFLMEFFEMPEGYSVSRIAKIVPHELGKPQFLRRSDLRVYRERPYFTCFIEGL